MLFKSKYTHILGEKYQNSVIFCMLYISQESIYYIESSKTSAEARSFIYSTNHEYLRVWMTGLNDCQGNIPYLNRNKTIRQFIIDSRCYAPRIASGKVLFIMRAIRGESRES